MNDWKDYMWDDFIKREELESSPGIIDENMIQALTLNTYLIHIREMVMDGTGQFPDYVYEHLEDVMMNIFLCYSHVVEGHRPELEEISAHLKRPENIEALRNLTTLCVNSNPDNWSNAIEQLRELLPDTDLSRIDWNNEERRQNAEKWKKMFEEKGYIEL